jgi:CelD/BcsL family acetyltransferase involved in cellulose biosynthesis
VPVSILDPLSYPSWDSLLETSDQATFFHTAAWARVLSESYGYKPLYFTMLDSGKLVGLIPVMEVDSWLTGKRGVSLPFTDICHPIADSAGTFQELLDAVVGYGRKAGWKHIELRGGSRFISRQPASAQHFVHTLDLSPDESTVRKRFKSNTLRNISKAERGGVEVAIERSHEAVAAYYQLHCGTRRHHGLPPQPWSFFEKIYRHIIATGQGFVSLASHKGQRIAGLICLYWKDQAIYKFGASDRASLNLRPNNLVMWEAIRWCCRNSIRGFHFGRTEPENDGLLQFKRCWGAAEDRFQYFNYDTRANGFVAGSTGRKTSYSFFKLMPLPMLKLTGGLLYRHVG